MKNKKPCVPLTLILTLTLALGLTLTLLWLLDGKPPVAQAQGPDGYDTYYVALSCNGVPIPCFTTVQAAVDAADDPDDVVKVASGTYTGVQARPAPPRYVGPSVITQMVYISKTVTIQGGYTNDSWHTSAPEANPTVLDARGQGRVLHIIGNISPTIESLHITGGDATNLGGGPPWGGGFGGGLCIVTATANLSKNSVFSNAAHFGGGLYLWQSASTIRNNIVSSNTAFWSGGGILLYESSATMLTSNTVASNAAETYGGGLTLESSAAILSGNTIISNSSIYGGGLRLWYSTAMLSGNTILSNSAGSGGGALLEYSPATLNGNAVISNSAGVGGGLTLDNSDAALYCNTVTFNTANYGGGGLRLANSDAILVANTISSNRAEFVGGGLLIDNSSATLNANTVAFNSTNTGGGLRLYFSNTTLTKNIIISNTANTGGGLSLWSSNATLDKNVIISNSASSGSGLSLEFHSDATLTNNVVVGNYAHVTGTGRLPISGSGLHIAGSSPRLLHTTLAHNNGGDGSGIHIASDGSNNSTVVLTNTILVSHAVGITVANDNTVTLNGVLWFSNGANVGGAGAITTTHAITGNPDFAPDGYHILSNSVAIDAGVEEKVRTDVDTQPRPYQVPDLGADEYWPPGTLKHVYLPLVLRQPP